MEYTLDKLEKWRDLGGGPKLGIIANFDERLPNIFEGIRLIIWYKFIK